MVWNKETRAAYMKKYRKENEERIREVNEKYREKNRDILNAKQREYYENHREEIRQLYVRLVRDGICPICRKRPLMNGRYSCGECLEAAGVRGQRRREKFSACGLCQTCGIKLDPARDTGVRGGTSKCVICTEYESDRKRIN